jgi:zona occludens toxin
MKEKMIIFYEGVPGSGKSYDAIVKIVANLKKGRKVYTNIDGVENVKCKEMIKCMTGLDDFDIDEKLIVLERDQVFHFWDFVTPGSFVVIDEAQKFFNSRDWQKEENRRCADWCSTHRHEGYDALFLTQKIEKVDTQVRTLTEWTYRYKKVNFVGNLINQSYICFAFSGDDTSNPLTKIIRRYDKKYFACYKSYISKDVKELNIQVHANILKHPVFFLIPIVLCVLVYFTYKSIHNHINPFKPKSVAYAAAIPAKFKAGTVTVVPYQSKSSVPSAAVASAPPVITKPKSDLLKKTENKIINKKHEKYFAEINGKKISYCEGGLCEK